jgi:hypothetical protein
VEPALEGRLEGSVDEAMALDAALALEGGRNHVQSEMRLALGPRPRMARMQV